MKKFLAMILCLLLCMSLFACSEAPKAPENEPDPAPVTEKEKEPEKEPVAEPEVKEPEIDPNDPIAQLTNGYWVHSYTAEGHGDYTYYFHFYPEDPVLGAVFYAGFSNNRQNFVGTYTIREEATEWKAYPDRQSKVDDKSDDDSGRSSGTAPYVISLADFNGNPMGELPYDMENIYNTLVDGDVLAAQGSTQVFYLHDTEGKYQSAYDGELGISYINYEADEDKTSTLQLSHNMTYTDLVGAMIEGTYAVAKNADGGMTFTLTPNDSTDTGAVIVTSADKMTCTYTPDGGDAIAMHVLGDNGPEVSFTFAGVYNIVAYNMDADVTMVLYADGTFASTMAVAGNSMDLLKGGWEQDGYTIHFTSDKGDKFDTFISEQQTMCIQLVAAGTQVGDVDATLEMVKEVKEPVLQYTFAGKFNIAAYGIDADVTMLLYDDGSFTSSMAVAGNAMDLVKGTWVQDGYTIHFTTEAGEAFDTFIDNQTMCVQLVVAGTQVGDVDATLTMVK